MFSQIFNEEKIKSHIRELNSMLQAPPSSEDNLDKLLQLIKLGCWLDLVDLTQESEEKKLQMKQGKMSMIDSSQIVNDQIDNGTKEDVFMANLQRAMENMVQDAKVVSRDVLTQEQIAEAESYIAQLTKEKLRPDDYAARLAAQQAQASIPAATTAPVATPTAAAPEFTTPAAAPMVQSAVPQPIQPPAAPQPVTAQVPEQPISQPVAQQPIAEVPAQPVAVSAPVQSIPAPISQQSIAMAPELPTTPEPASVAPIQPITETTPAPQPVQPPATPPQAVNSLPALPEAPMPQLSPTNSLPELPTT